MTRVWIAQCLCPHRHCILAAAGEAEHKDEAKEAVLTPLENAVAELLAEGTINPWCGICYSPADAWRYELGRTSFESMQEAQPSIAKVQAELIAAGAVAGELLGPKRNRGVA